VLAFIVKKTFANIHLKIAMESFY